MPNRYKYQKCMYQPPARMSRPAAVTLHASAMLGMFVVAHILPLGSHPWLWVPIAVLSAIFLRGIGSAAYELLTEGRHKEIELGDYRPARREPATNPPSTWNFRVESSDRWSA